MNIARRIFCHALLFAFIMPFIIIIFITILIAVLAAIKGEDLIAMLISFFSKDTAYAVFLIYAFGAPASVAAGAGATLFRSWIWSSLIMIVVSNTVLLLQLLSIGPMYAPKNFLLYCFLAVLFSSLTTQFIVRQRLFSFAH